MKKTIISSIYSFLFISIFFALPSYAATIKVNSTDDAIDNVDGLCTLREAIIAANTDAPSGAVPGECIAGNGADSLDLTDLVGTIIPTNSFFSITDDLSIEGPGSDRLAIQGRPPITIFDFSTGGGSNFHVAGLTIRNAATAIGIDSDETALIEDCYFDSNSGLTAGPAVHIRQNAIVSILRSTFSNNEVDNGGACGGALFISTGSVLNISNSTFVGNRASGTGGAICTSQGDLFLNNVTIVDNLADSDNDGNGGGGGLFVTGGTISLQNSIIANNTDLNGLAQDCFTIGNGITSLDYNVITDLTNCTVNGMTNNNIIGQDPLLGALAINGGSMPTLSPLAGSPVIDAANPAACTDENAVELLTDQRGNGFLRTADGDNDGNARCDIGAFEVICGDGFVHGNEECDDANASNTDDCLNSCEIASCGDGFVEDGVEACDDGNTADGDGCDQNCEIEVVEEDNSDEDDSEEQNNDETPAEVVDQETDAEDNLEMTDEEAPATGNGCALMSSAPTRSSPYATLLLLLLVPLAILSHRRTLA